MALIAVRRADGIEKIVEDYAKLDSDEKQGKIIVENAICDEKIEALFNAFKEARIHYDVENNITYMECYEFIPHVSDKEIQRFITASIRHEQDKDYSMRLGLFLGEIIQRQYHRGMRSFSLDFRMLSRKPDNLCSMFTPAERISIKVQGEAGDNCIEKARNISLKINKTKGGCGYNGRDLIVEAEEIGDGCFSYGENIEANIEKIGKNCGWAKNSTYRTRNRNTFDYMKHFTQKGQGNRVVLVNTDGSEEVCVL